MKDQDTKQAMLTAFVEQLGKIPAVLLSTKEGVGLVAIMTGALLKASHAGEYDGWEIVGSVTIREEGSPDHVKDPAGYCEWLKTNYPKTYEGTCRYGRHNSLTVDAFPFNLDLFGVNIIPPDFGRMPVPDLLIAAGFMAMTADFIGGALKGLGEIVPG
jgi:hypothetical protein